MRLIAFTGFKGSGKDTAASVAVENGFEHIKFADALKAMLRTLLSYQGVPADMVESYIEGDRKELATAFLGGRSMRHAMQTLGTDWGRKMISPDIWVDVTRERCLMFDKVVISDVRFPNEAEMIAALGGKLYRVDRPAHTVQADHESEARIPSLPVDGVLVNDALTPAAFKLLIWDTLFRG